MGYVPLDPIEKEKRLSHIQSGLDLGKKWSDIAIDIGMTESSVAQFWYRYGKIKKETIKRICMCCRRDFESEGKHNRLCVRCKTEKTPSPWEVVVGASRQVGRG